jgi:DNA mismatch repair protein MutL
LSNKIHILPEHVMKRIAAGEVVERPASVVKELVENAIDAGASSITVILKGSGLELIQVVDDGEGMTETDALVCCQRHATSKIACAEDLEEITTLGFRGEALASIGSVSRMVITTRTEADSEATQVYLENSQIQEVQKVAAPKGTSISVKELFASVPARRKFLKRPPTELRHTVGMLRRMALSHPTASFMLFVENDKIMDVRNESSRNRVRALWGEEKAARLIPVLKQISAVSIEGFISRPDDASKNRDDQFFFLNRRTIQNKSLSHAVVSAYGTRIRPGEFPAFVLFLEMDPKRFDANVHPTKIEVRFADERFLYDVLRKTVEETLRSPETITEFQLIPGKKGESAFRRPSIHPVDYGQLSLAVQSVPSSDLEQSERSRGSEEPLFWQIHNRYILSQIKSGLTLIDQHVAHERVLYEKALRAIQEKSGSSQQLLFPTTVQLNQEDMLALTEILAFLEKIGFGLKDFGKNTVVIESVPVDVKAGREKELLLEIIDYYKQAPVSGGLVWDKVAKAYACKSAIKAGEKLSQVEMALLVDQLFATKDPYFCPHGRPVVVKVSIEEIDKRFGRSPE